MAFQQGADPAPYNFVIIDYQNPEVIHYGLQSMT
jgi:hypothetical protein